MATLIAADLTRPSERDAYEARVIAANRRLAEAGITRIDYRHLNDGLKRFIESIARFEK